MASKNSKSVVSNCNHNHTAKDHHGQKVMNIISKLPTKTFNDGIDSSAFMLGPELLGNFVGPELGGFISDISGEFDFGF